MKKYSLDSIVSSSKEKLFYETYNKIKGLFELDQSVDLIVVESRQELDDLGLDLAEWVIGFYNENYQIIILDKNLWKDKDSTNMEKLILHEFVHISMLKYQDHPSWLEEGLAVVLSGQYEDMNLEYIDLASTDFYGLDYYQDNFYDISAKAVLSLIEDLSLNKIVELLTDENEKYWNEKIESLVV